MMQSGTVRYSCVITLVDPTATTSTGQPAPIIQGVIKSVKTISISLYNIPSGFRWPVVGETWMVIQYNGSWYLDGMFPFGMDTAHTIVDYDQGDLVLNSSTGKLAVVGTSDVTGDNGDWEMYYDGNLSTLVYEHDGSIYPLRSGDNDVLLAQNNLSDVESTSTALSNLGALVPWARFYTDYAQTIDNGIEAMILTAEGTWTSGNGMIEATNSIQVPSDGYYHCSANLTLVSTNPIQNGYMQVEFYHNGSSLELPLGVGPTSVNGTDYPSAWMIDIIECSANDTIGFGCYNMMGFTGTVQGALLVVHKLTA